MRNLTLLTDLYELTMMQGYFHNSGMNETTEEMATLAGEIIMHGVQVLQTKGSR